MQELYKKISEKRYKKIKGYKIDRWIFQSVMWTFLIFTFFVAWHYNFELDYYSCTGPSQNTFSLDKGFEDKEFRCKNPFYKESWKNQEFLPPGEYGVRPTTLYRSVFYVAIGLMILGLLINHLIYNRGWKPKNDFGFD